MSNFQNLTSQEENVFTQLQSKTPAFVYFESHIKKNITNLHTFPAPFGLTLRFAMKANPNLSILKLINEQGMHIDASSANECYRAIAAGVKPNHILLTSQEVPNKKKLTELISQGVQYNACSMLQLENYAKLFPNTNISIRFNIGVGSGWNASTSTGGLSSSFGIFGQRDEIKSVLAKQNVILERIHLHIGSGADPQKQKQAALEGIKLLTEFPSATILNLGGGIKVARMPHETQTDVVDLGAPTAKELELFAETTGRKIRLELEPGTAAIANEGYIVSTIIDKVNTGKEGFTFLKINSGMTDNARIPMYGAQHPFKVIQLTPNHVEKEKYVIMGSCCESGDLLTCKPNEPETIEARELTYAQVGDLLIVGGAGAYCSSMSGFNYNSKQKSAEYLYRENDELILIRKQESRDDVWAEDILI